jgi:hypothetical protein
MCKTAIIRLRISEVYKCSQNVISTNILCNNELSPGSFISECMVIAT